MKLYIAVLLAVAIFSSCSSSQKKDEWAMHDSGLKIQQVCAGSGGAASKGDKICIHYIASLESGEEFENTYIKSKPFTFTLGKEEVIKGLDMACEGMKPGEKRKVVIPASLGFGDRSIGKIPANSTLVFQVELVEIK